MVNAAMIKLKHRRNFNIRTHVSNGGAEFAGQENEGQRNFRGEKCRTGKGRTKVQGWNLRNWKMTDKSAAGNMIRTNRFAS